MGKILSSKVENDKFIFTISLDSDEALHLQGHVDNIHVLSENTPQENTNIAGRGRNSAAKYFLIPRRLRKDVKFPKEVACQRLDTKSKTIFVYLVDKLDV